MTLLSRAKAMPLPEPQKVCWIGHELFTADQLRAAREQIAAEGDEVIGRLCEALQSAEIGLANLLSYQGTGASRMGDVWLAADHSRTTGYDWRVNVEDCTQWGREP